VSGGGAYKSPLTNSCSSNFNVFLTDGDPTRDQDADTEIAGLKGEMSTADPPAANTCSDNGGDGSASLQVKGDGRCLDDVAKYMYDQDLLVDATITDRTKDPKNNVRTYTIGFGTGISECEHPGQHCQGRRRQSVRRNRRHLADRSISRTSHAMVSESPVSFSAPTVAVNAFNRTQNLNDLFHDRVRAVRPVSLAG
jgi:type IV pilus assembly protein PilY1